MSETNRLSHTHCAVLGCRTSIFNKSTGITFHPLPGSVEMKNRWLAILKNRCTNVNETKSKICSKHFESRFLTPNGRLKENAIPTIFSATVTGSTNRLGMKTSDATSRDKMDRLLNKLTQSQLVADIKSTMSLIKVPDNFSDCVTDDLQCVPDTPVEAQLWLLIKKQDHLITRLNQLVAHNKKHVEVLQKNMEENKSSKKEMEQSVETLKYVVKCLQEKHATLEEQIEILTAVESR